MYHRPTKHISWHVTAIAAGVLIGTALAAFLPYHLFAGAYWLVIAVSAMVVALIRRTTAVLLLALTAGLIAGLWSGAGEMKQLAQYETYYDQQVIVSGTVSDDTTFGPGGDRRMRLQQVSINEQNMKGQIWLNTSANIDIKRGDIVWVEGELKEGFGTISASIFRGRVVNVERHSFGDVGRKVRDRFSEGVFGAMPETEAALGVSYLMGHRKILPDDLQDRLRILGLTHLVVASGFHLTVLVSLARRRLAGVSKYFSTLLSFSIIGTFLLLTGFSTSMTRASLVAGISLVAWYFGRNVHPVKLLLLVAALTALMNPSFVWGDVGWYLSFSAFAGVIILAPLIHHYFWGEAKEPGFARQMVVATISAQITTFPVIAYAFGLYSPLALVSNLVILPLVPLAMILTFVAGIAGLLLPATLAGAIGLPAYVILYYMTFITGKLAGSPWAYGEVSFDASMVAASYMIILFIMFYLWRKTGHSFRRDTPI